MVARENQYANVTDNRTLRKKILGATAVTPNPARHPIVRNDAKENRNQNLSPQVNTAKPYQAKTPIAPTANVLVQAPAMNLAEQQEPNAASAETAQNPNESSSLESSQAQFLGTIRDTEDLQEKIETELLDLNDRFSDTYALLLRDLETAVDLMDKLETIQEEADEAIAAAGVQQQAIF